MAGRGQQGGERREPVLRREEAPSASPFDIRLDASDRAGGPRPERVKPEKVRQEPTREERREPKSEGTARFSAPVEPEGSEVPARKSNASTRGKRGKAEAAKPERRPARKRRSVLGFLVKWCLVLMVWAGIGVAGIVAYEAAKLPPMQTLMVPKRPPTIMIQAADGKPLATRGDMGGAAVPLKQLPAYLPNAFIAIEDRRFYEHWGLDPWASPARWPPTLSPAVCGRAARP